MLLGEVSASSIYHHDKLTEKTYINYLRDANLPFEQLMVGEHQHLWLVAPMKIREKFQEAWDIARSTLTPGQRAI